jgi:lipopolysaccharide export system permease protein
MLYDIRVAKPAFDIKEGIFYDKLPGYAIKVGTKEKDGVSIGDIVIYENQSSLQDNIIVAKKGVMQLSADKKFLEFNLEDGWRYQEKGPFSSVETDYYRLGFKEYKKSFDLSSFSVLKTPDSIFKGNLQMLNVKQLDKAADSLIKSTGKPIQSRMNKEVSSYFLNGKKMDSSWKSTTQPVIPAGIKSYEELLPDTVFNTSYTRGSEKINLIKSSVDIIASDYEKKRKDLRFTLIEWHRKFALSFACFVLFMIGAPLGSIIRKGGLGMPLVIAVIFFLVFHLLNMFGEKFVRQDVLTPLGGMWLSTMVLVPIGIFLIYKAINDSQLFNMDYYLSSIKSIGRKMRLIKK